MVASGPGTSFVLWSVRFCSWSSTETASDVWDGIQVEKVENC